MTTCDLEAIRADIANSEALAYTKALGAAITPSATRDGRQWTTITLGESWASSPNGLPDALRALCASLGRQTRQEVTTSGTTTHP